MVFSAIVKMRFLIRWFGILAGNWIVGFYSRFFMFIAVIFVFGMS